jgi:hypothetical protein
VACGSDVSAASFMMTGSITVSAETPARKKAKGGPGGRPFSIRSQPA